MKDKQNKLGVERIKEEQDETTQANGEYKSAPENKVKEARLRSNPEYKQILLNYKHHIVKDELDIGPEVIQETCTKTDFVPKDEAEYNQCMSEDENYRQRTLAECNSEQEIKITETILGSNPEYKQLYEHHIVKDELVIGPEVKQETCTNRDGVPKNTEYDQRVSENENYRQRNLAECKSEPEIKIIETILRSNPEYKQLYKHHIVKDELVIGPEVKQETCTNTDCVPKDEAGNDQHMSEDENRPLRNKHRKPTIKSKIKPDTVCNLCNKEFTQKRSRDYHIKHNCPKNKNRIPQKQKYLKRKLKCKLCKKVLFSTMRNFWGHVNYHCPKNPNKSTYTCDTCYKCYQHKSTLIEHIKSEHSNTVNLVKFQCDYCGKELNKKANLTTHIKKMHIKKKIYQNAVCELCKNVFHSEAYKNYHMKNYCPFNQNKKKLICDTCNKCYQSKDSLIAHIMSKHTNTINIVKYQCDHCGKEYFRKTALIAHIKVKHVKKYNPVCALCKKMFVDKSHRDYHIKYICPKNKNKAEKPENKKKAVCNLCNKVFSSSSTRNKHLQLSCPMNQNKTSKSNRCDLCNKVFFTKERRNRHLKYSCPNNLNKTQRSPPKAKCDLCNKIFKNWMYYSKHRCSMNQGKRPAKLKCDFCKKEFASQETRRKHIKFNCQKNPNKIDKPKAICGLCNKVFVNSGYRNRHIKIHCPMNKTGKLSKQSNHAI